MNLLNRTTLALIAAALFSGCGGDDDNAPPLPPVQTLSASISRTEYGIPHIQAQNYRGMAFGLGYAYATDNFCVLMKEIVTVNGESARYFGETNDNVNQDFVMKLMFGSDETVRARFLNGASPNARDLLAGFADGMNLYLEETGVDNLPVADPELARSEGCRGGAWVRSITDLDMARHMARIATSTAGVGHPFIAQLMVAATPPQSLTKATDNPSPAELREHAIQRAKQRLETFRQPPATSRLASNAYAIGGDESGTGAGINVAWPHFSWEGAYRFYAAHLTVPGEYNAMGGMLNGFPVIQIGFNQSLAWTHTISTAWRATLFELELAPNDPTKYVVDGKTKTLEPVTVAVEVLTADGTLKSREHTFYISDYGPILDFGFGWPSPFNTVLAFGDVNLTNNRLVDQWLQIGQSENIPELQNALRTLGLPWVNTIAADSLGSAFYGDISAVPHVSDALATDCAGASAEFLDGFPVLDGSRSECNWGSDPDTPVGIFGYERLPQIVSREYVANANDSYWLANPRERLSGYPSIIGPENAERSFRTRLVFNKAEARLGGGLHVENVVDMVYENLDATAPLLRDGIVSLCEPVADWAPYLEAGAQATGADLDLACDLIAAWDGTANLASVGEHVYAAVVEQLLAMIESEPTVTLWRVPFDPADPVNTPRALNDSDAQVIELVRKAVARGVNQIKVANLPFDATVAEVQFVQTRNNLGAIERIPLHGGRGASVFEFKFEPGKGYFDPVDGDSWIHVVTWNGTSCPDARGVLTYSQSTNPVSPHFDDQTRLYSNKQLIDLPFCDADIETAKIPNSDKKLSATVEPNS